MSPSNVTVERGKGITARHREPLRHAVPRKGFEPPLPCGKRILSPFKAVPRFTAVYRCVPCYRGAEPMGLSRCTPL